MLAGVYLAPEGLMKDADDIAGLAGSIDETRYDNRYEVLGRSSEASPTRNQVSFRLKEKLDGGPNGFEPRRSRHVFLGEDGEPEEVEGVMSNRRRKPSKPAIQGHRFLRSHWIL